MTIGRPLRGGDGGRTNLAVLGEHPLNERTLAAVIALSCVLWTVVPGLVLLSPPLDVIEGYMWGREWPVATYKHPALPAWLAEFSRVVTFGQIGWPVYLVSQLFAAATMLLVFQLGSDLRDRASGVAAALSLVAFEHLSWRSAEFNHTIAQLPFWVGVVAATWRCTIDGRTIWWIAIGAVGALGLYAKLSNVLIVLTAVGWLAWHQPTRRQFLTAAPWLGAGVFIAVAAPLAYWLFENDLQPLHYAAERSQDAKMSLWAFLWKSAIAGLPVVALLAFGGLFAAGQRAAPVTEPADEQSKLARAFILVMAFVPLVAVILAVLVRGGGLRVTWSAPLVAMLPVVLLTVWPMTPRNRDDAVRLVVAAVLASSMTALGFGIYQLGWSSRGGNPSRINWPERAISAAAAKAWGDATGGRPLRIVAGDSWCAGLAGIRNPDRPSIFTLAEPTFAPWITPQRLARDGALLVWEEAREPHTEGWRKLRAGRASLPLELGARPARAGSPALRYIVIPPQ